ncbi:hypothetical protein HVY04_17900 [Citrobacter freundii]|uniref:hypothetical protein n=1 Tax=Silvania sp. TaxID=3016633 RepID=UPI0015EAA74A|nr:hypothetical protein [Citrobacter freundii]QMJ04894.1 hypothetical protein HVY06_17920 [Citrobacter freundii]QMJ13959.1 hypothetical protein HVY04_17900 [Citrobacter freundii]
MTEQLKKLLAELERLCMTYPDEITAFKLDVIGQGGTSLANFTFLADADPAKQASQQTVN